jgi:ketosteroid isomerase-like protein
MKNTTMWCLVGLLSLGSAAWAQAQTGESEKAVAALESQWMQSQKTNNPELIAPALADNLIDTESNGKVSNKTQMLAHAKGRKYASVGYEQMLVTVFGDTAIATGAYRGKGTEATGKSFEEYERFTDTWVKMPNGKWQCVATQSSSVSS